jgi:malic enzyme
MLLSMARDPIVFACANPMPEIDPEIGEIACCFMQSFV